MNNTPHVVLSQPNIAFRAEQSRPVTTQRLMQRIRKWRANPRKSKLLHSLSNLNSQNKRRLGRRQTRSDGRGSLAMALLYIAYNLEFSTMSVCLNDTRFSRPSRERICKETGLSVSRLRRALKKCANNLVDYLEIERVTVCEDDEFKEEPNIIRVKPKLFIELGLGFDYHKEKYYKLKKLEKKNSKLAYKNILRKIGVPQKNERAGQRGEHHKLAREFQQRNPTWTFAYDIAMKMNVETLKNSLARNRSDSG